MKPEAPSPFESVAKATPNPELTEAILETLASVSARKFALFSYDPGRITIETKTGMELGWLDVSQSDTYEINQTVGDRLAGTMSIEWARSGDQVRYWFKRNSYIIEDRRRYSSVQELAQSGSFTGFLTELGA